jgi:lipoprotein-anchoring transpeptidase ErfK/SrfK
MALGSALLLAGCGGSDAAWHSAGDRAASKDPAPDITVSQPANDATGVPTAVEIVYTTTGDGGQATVELTAADGTAVPGAPRPDGAAWLPAKQLKYDTRYTAKVSTTVKGKVQTETVAFTTMPRPAGLVRVSSVVGDDQVVGVGMPLILTLSADVAKAQRADVQRRLFVTADPPQEGAWNWFNAHEVHYRPKEYWKAGTKLSLRAALGGLPIGNNRYALNDLTVHAAIGKALIMKVDNGTKQMTVTEDGRVVRTIPVSLGKATSPSASGNMIVMIKSAEEWFDSSTYGVPADSKDGYKTLVKFVQRLTWDGEYIHAAPWSEADQGHRNVSHGCTNVSTVNAEWLFGVTHIGDPVIVTGTEEHLKWGNGYTDWDIPFEEYAKGGASPAPSAPGSGSAGPSPTRS